MRNRPTHARECVLHTGKTVTAHFAPERCWSRAVRCEQSCLCVCHTALGCAGSSRCGGGDEDGGDIDDAAVVAALLQEAARHLPSISGALDPENPALWVRKGARPASCTSRPCVGEVPGCEGLILAAGHEGSGITMALSTAEVAAALLLRHEAPPEYAKGLGWYV